MTEMPVEAFGIRQVFLQLSTGCFVGLATKMTASALNGRFQALFRNVSAKLIARLVNNVLASMAASE